jgi:MFS family permease
MDALQSVFYATSIELGGLGLPPRTIGYCLSTFAFINGTLQACFFAPLVRRFGPRRLFLTGVTIFVPVFGMFPLINTVARTYGTGPVVWCLLVFQFVLLVSMDMAYSTYSSSSMHSSPYSPVSFPIYSASLPIANLLCLTMAPALVNRLHVHLHYGRCTRKPFARRDKRYRAICRGVGTRHRTHIINVTLLVLP